VSKLLTNFIFRLIFFEPAIMPQLATYFPVDPSRHHLCKISWDNITDVVQHSHNQQIIAKEDLPYQCHTCRRSARADNIVTQKTANKKNVIYWVMQHKKEPEGSFLLATYLK